MISCNSVTTTHLDRESADLEWYLEQEVPEVVNLHPRTHLKAFTYAPKIAAVLQGECCQTIREINPNAGPRRRIHAGDTIIFHGWKGRPYHSSWSKWRLTVEVTVVEELRIDSKDGFTIIRPGAIFTGKWSGMLADHLARQDHIDPPTGHGLRAVLQGLNGTISGKTFQIIRWRPEDAYLDLDQGGDAQ